MCPSENLTMLIPLYQNMRCFEYFNINYIRVETSEHTETCMYTCDSKNSRTCYNLKDGGIARNKNSYGLFNSKKLRRDLGEFRKKNL